AAAGVPLDVNSRARARRFGVENEYINKWQVFERDEWICGLCRSRPARTVPGHVALMALSVIQTF
ncbi:MAG: hypothetical protein WAK42_10295, partial [Mycobacterium sp.]